MLTDEQVITLWNNFDVPAWAKWQKDYLDFVAWAREAPEAELRIESAQKRLWNARVITPAGYGDAVNVGALLADQEVVDAIVGLRTRAWPTDTSARAAAIQGEFERILAMAVARGLKPRPAAKLHRLIGVLLPGELTCVLNYDANRHAAELLLGNASEPGPSGQVKMRARLRAVLGEEKDLAEHVRRSTFCWWLHENHPRLVAGQLPPWKDKDPSGSKAGEGDNLVRPPEDKLPPLVLWPFAKQFMGNFGIRNFGAAYRAVVQAALPGLSQDDLVGVLQASGDFENIAAQSLRLLIIRVKGLGFVEERGGLLYPTKDGEELLGSGQFDILIERFFERIFGFAQLLRFVAEHPGANDEAMVGALRALYPNWTTARVPTDLRNWSSYLGLLKRDGSGALSLTEYGAAWVARLPKELPTPPVEESVETTTTTTVAASPTVPYPEFDAILARFKADSEIANFVFDDRQLATLHAAWRSNPRKRFVLLSGLSGTGKTAVTLCYSRAVCELMGLSVSDHREIVPVSPDWRDPSGLLGYFNALHADPTFQAEPALRLVLRAAADPGRPYYLILDEMNLARVERYFAPFLSAMETGKDLVLHANGVAVNDVPPRVPWPANLHIAGTVNMDETTYPFSDKVLDRAFTLEFWDVDLKSFFDRAAAKAPEKRLPEVEETLLELHDAMRGIRRHFGYRTAGEVLAFMQACSTLGGATSTTFLDQAVFSKVLPRLRGEDTAAVKGALETLMGICKRRGLGASEAKLGSMMEQLRRTGVTRFWA
ncbi:ATP-binding protein [Polyangium sp. 15x6]|uniref:McrB family protein n=1 Tax=Polyangium sp. 15x6 TaxID=3042687 RepID=UPI00249A3FEC|nr:ATP-binding protein [Polyangium sp. 15x6]MDI3289763.1 ATP-binding protein [Polyangium sp. 15x6]